MVVYSHGLGGSPIGKGYVETIAALASPRFRRRRGLHADNRFSRVRIDDLSDFFYLVTQYDRVAEMMLMRPVALKAMTDVLLAHPQFGAAIDADHIAGFGASLGGQAIANLMGAKLTTSIDVACSETVRDPRIKVGVGYVPYSGQTFLPSFCEGQSGASEVTRPYLAIAGTADTTAPLSRTRQAVSNFKGSRYLVELGEWAARAAHRGHRRPLHLDGDLLPVVPSRGHERLPEALCHARRVWRT
jgi:predicted dienelactone hydrolase